jgi:hypothetical protein
VIVGIGRQVSPIGGYGAGDWRGDPTISTIVNGGIALTGVILILSAVIPPPLGLTAAYTAIWPTNLAVAPLARLNL